MITTALVAAAAAAAPPAAFALLDSVPPLPVTQDLGSPDARPAPLVTQDLRSPDARDAGRGVVVSKRPPVSGPVGRAVNVSGAGFAWLEAGLAATLALALIAFGTGTVRRRRPATSG